MNHELLYYCFGNASPIDELHNPILSIASARRHSNIPITVLHCENNADFYKPYVRKLNFKLQKFNARAAGYHQVAFKSADALAYMQQEKLDAVLVSDTDVMFHNDVSHYFDEMCESNKSVYVNETLNTGIFGLNSCSDMIMVNAWVGICTLLDKYRNTAFVQKSMMEIYGDKRVSDETTLVALYNLLKINDYCHYYKHTKCYRASRKYKIKDLVFQEDQSKIEAIHHILSDMRRALGKTDINRTKIILSIREYATMMKEVMGHALYKTLPHTELVYNLNDYMNKQGSILAQYEKVNRPVNPLSLPVEQD